MQYLERLPFVLATVVCTALISACNFADTASATTNATASEIPSAIPHAIPSASPSAQVNASAELSWQAPSQNTDGSKLTNISGYHIHVGTDPKALDTIIDVTDASATSYLVNNLLTGTWYFGISAYNTAGVEGALSNIGSKTVG